MNSILGIFDVPTARGLVVPQGQVLEQGKSPGAHVRLSAP